MQGIQLAAAGARRDVWIVGSLSHQEFAKNVSRRSPGILRAVVGPGPHCLLSEELVAFLQGPVAVVVATRDEVLRPEIARGWGIEVADDRAAVTLCVDDPGGAQTRANLEANGEIAVTCSLPSTYRAVQLKGRTLQIRPPDERQRSAVLRHLEGFVEEVAAMGVRADGARTFLRGDLLSVTFGVRELYDQTPGANAGAQL
jgi:Pyridoxamine 5'-phosphate oxidase